jgi:hypothetical protein
MTDQDLNGFQAVLRRLAAVFRVRTDTEDFRALGSSYFRALSGCSLGDLERGADVWIGSQQKFPKPQEWRMVIPHQSHDRVLSDTASREHSRAEALHWQSADLCHCEQCVKAGVDHKPLRYVPNEPQEPVRHGLTGRPTLAGHWAHGAELARWYAGKVQFYAQHEKLTKKPFNPERDAHTRRTRRGKLLSLVPAVAS